MISTGDILEIDLGSGAMVRRPPDLTELRTVVGGRGLVALNLLREVGPQVDPLSPANSLFFFTGLLTGTRAPGSSRLHVGARSPLTGLSGSSSVGGEAGRALRRNGIFGLVLRGAAAHPVYLTITDGEAELHDAGELWGSDTTATFERLHHDNEKAATLAIGPAGEHLAAIACIVTDRGHAAGRTGMGAVMGAKLLKAIVISGSARPKADDAAQPEGAASDGTTAGGAVKRYLSRIVAAPAFDEYREYGSSSSVLWCNDNDILGTRNYSASQFTGAAATDGTSLKSWVTHTQGCSGCPIHCKAEVRLRGSRYGDLIAERPDFEPLVAWGAKVGIDDIGAVVMLHNICDRLGLDSISAGAAAAFAIDLFEHGIIDTTDTGGLELRWGDPDPLPELLAQMGSGSGFGGLLAGGVRRAAEAIGRGADRFAAHVKGLELPAYDPRGAYGAALGMAVSGRGGDYTSVYVRHEFDMPRDEARRLYGDDYERAGDPVLPDGKAAMVRLSMITSAALDALGLCKIPALTLLNEYGLQSEAELVREVAGLDLSAADLTAAGERIVVLERLFNGRCGADMNADDLPSLFRSSAESGQGRRTPSADSPGQGAKPRDTQEGGIAVGEKQAHHVAAHHAAIDITAMRTEFYRLMGWSASGLPTAETLARLGLTDEVAALMTTE
jgi:aldehyde:ferredoxin oxidoreductase